MQTTLNSKIALGAALLLTGLALAGGASAADLKSVSTTFSENIGSTNVIIAVGTFIIGLVFIGAGIAMIKKHNDHPREGYLAKAIVGIVAGSMLIAIPTVTGVGINSIFGDGAQQTKVGGSIESIE